MTALLNPLSLLAARRLPLLLAIVGACAFVAGGGPDYISAKELAKNANWLREIAKSWPAIAPLIYVAAVFIALQLLIIPAWFCSVLAGLVFGLWHGAIYAILGVTLGGMGVFLASREGFNGLKGRGGSSIHDLAEGFRRDGLAYLLILRLIPVVPFTLVNIAAAVSNLTLRTFTLGTLLGIVPSILVFAWSGDALIELLRRGDKLDGNLLLQPKFLLPLLTLAALAALPLVARRHLKRWGGKSLPKAGDDPMTKTGRRQDRAPRSPSL
jgi:uncharacterized membrane protein YdjX (TVP38/TMEM64 family)